MSESHCPRLMRGLVIHTRKSPRFHQFRARVTTVQLPLRSLAAKMATPGFGWAIDRWALLAVHRQDHGDGRPLLEWAEAQLLNAGITEADGEIWLSCLPRMLGYVFKPVSFWFCENKAGNVVAILAEVNNTFGDRHAYVLDCRPGYRDGQTIGQEKRFYVSPFFPERGHYQFRFHHEKNAAGTSLARIEVVEGHGAALITSISGRTKPLTHASASAAWIAHPLSSLSVIALIHWQALILWIKRVPLFPRRPSTV